jgi:hypothetical protein
MEGDGVILVFDVVKSRFVYICLSVSASCRIKSMKEGCISKYRSESATSDRPKQHDMEQDYRLAVLSAAIRAGEISGEADGFNPRQYLLQLKEQRSK